MKKTKVLLASLMMVLLSAVMVLQKATRLIIQIWEKRYLYGA